MSSHNNEIVMVIPGASAQIPLIKALHQSGYAVVCVNPYEDSPAFAYADHNERHDILDVDACTEVARKYGVCAVMSDECDIAMPTVAAVSERLGLRSLGVPMAELYTNKRAMRDYSVKNGFPCPAYRECATAEEAGAFFNSLSVPKMIIKPLDSNSSRGVFTIESTEQLEGLFDVSLSYSKISKAVLCEEYIEGTEFTIDGIMLHGRHYSLAVSEKKHYRHHPNIACELYFSHENPRFDYDRLRAQNDLYVERSGLEFGFTHAEYKFDGERFVLIEIGARGGGNYISSHVVPAMTGLDNYRYLIDAALGKDGLEEIAVGEQYKSRCCVLRFFDVDPENDGKQLKEIRGEAFLEEHPKVLLHGFQCHAGETFKVADNDSQRIGFYIACGDTRRQLDALMEQIGEKIQFVF